MIYPLSRGILLILAVLGCAAIAVRYWRHRVWRKSHLDQLAAQRPELIRDMAIQIAAGNSASAAQEFHRERLIRWEQFVTPRCLAVLRDEALAHISEMKRTFIPTHKKGATLSYEQIHTLAPHCLAFYHSPEVQRWVSTITGMTVYPTPDQDQSSLSLLCYHEPGDHIHWHYDHNFYRGRHFTVLLSLVNEGADGGLSQGTFQRRISSGEQNLDTSPNVLIIFEGARVRHRATPIGSGERRIMLSMTYCADPEISRLKEFVRRCKDTAFFGLRALWD
jgi:hypothetical protein